MCNQNWARLVLCWLVLISGFFLVITLEESPEKDETFLTQFMAPSTGHVDEQMVFFFFFPFQALFCFFFTSLPTVMSDGSCMLGFKIVFWI